MEKFSLRGLEFKNSSIDGSSSHGDQAEEYFPHPNDYIYYEESNIDEDKNQYAYKDDEIPQTFKEWQIDFEARYPESKRMLI